MSSHRLGQVPILCQSIGFVFYGHVDICAHGSSSRSLGRHRVKAVRANAHQAWPTQGGAKFGLVLALAARVGRKVTGRLTRAGAAQKLGSNKSLAQKRSR